MNGIISRGRAFFTLFACCLLYKRISPTTYHSVEYAPIQCIQGVACRWEGAEWAAYDKCYPNDRLWRAAASNLVEESCSRTEDTGTGVCGVLDSAAPLSCHHLHAGADKIEWTWKFYPCSFTRSKPCPVMSRRRNADFTTSQSCLVDLISLPHSNTNADAKNLLWDWEWFRAAAVMCAAQVVDVPQLSLIMCCPSEWFRIVDRLLKIN